MEERYSPTIPTDQWLSSVYLLSNLWEAALLDGAQDGGGASVVGLQGHMTCCSGR